MDTRTTSPSTGSALDLHQVAADRALMTLLTIRRVSLAVGMLLLSSLAIDRAEAQSSVSSLEARDRELARLLQDLERPSRIWWGSWTAVMAALTASQVVLSALEEGDTKESRGQRAAYITGASLSGAGLVVVLATPMPGRNAYTKYKAGPTDLGSRVAQGEALLEASARAAERARSWLPHTLALGLGLGVGLGLGLGYDDAWLGIKGGVGTAFVIEARALSYPQRARRHLDAYRGLLAQRELFVTPLVAKDTLGLTLTIF